MTRVWRLPFRSERRRAFLRVLIPANCSSLGPVLPGGARLDLRSLPQLENNKGVPRSSLCLSLLGSLGSSEQVAGSLAGLCDLLN